MPNKIKHLIEYSSAQKNPTNYFLSLFGLKLQSRDKEKAAFFDENLFSGVELGMWSGGFFDSQFQINQKQVNLFKDIGIEIPRFHGCFEFMVPTNKKIFLNLASGADESVKSAKVQIEIAREISTIEKPVIVFHPGFVFDKNQRDRGIDCLKRNLEKIVSFASDNSVIIALENMPVHDELEYLGSDPEEITSIIDEFNSPFLQMNFDWGHINSYARSIKAKDNFSFISSAIKHFSQRIIHAHLHYNKSCEDDFVVQASLFKATLIAFSSCFLSLKFVKIAISDDFDRHLPFLQIRQEYLEGFKDNVRDLVQHSRISEYGYITHEIIPKKIFKILTVEKDGATDEDYLKGVKFLKEIIDEKKD